MSHALVIPFTPELMRQAAGADVVVKIDALSDVVAAIDAAGRNNLKLVRIWARPCANLSEIALCDIPTDLPIALEIAGIGSLARCRAHVSWLSRHNVRLYLPLQSRQNAVDLRVLSSLGLHCCGMITGEEPQNIDWDAVYDLAVYSLFGTQPHGEIDPFSYLRANCGNGRLVDFGQVFFDSPRRYFQVAEDGSISFSRAGMLAGKKIAAKLSAYRDVIGTIEYQLAISEHRSFFEQPTECARCEVWRLCLGRFADSAASGGCRAVFQQVIECHEADAKKTPSQKQIWRH
jgi:hypothetical protein